MHEVPVNKSIGPTWADSYQTPEIGLAEGVMKLAEGVTSKLWLWGKYSLEKWINTFVQKIYEKGATPLVCWVHMGGFMPHSQNRGWRRTS